MKIECPVCGHLNVKADLKNAKCDNCGASLSLQDPKRPF